MKDDTRKTPLRQKDCNQTAHSIMEQVISWNEEPQQTENKEQKPGICMVTQRRRKNVRVLPTIGKPINPE